jgi:hypothetical protein
MSESEVCPEDGGALFYDPDHPSGIGKLNRRVSVLICKTCEGMFAQQSDGTFSRAVPPKR